MTHLPYPSLFSVNNTPVQEGELLAAVDLGSNSFHMLVARYTAGQFEVVARQREAVRIAEGLNDKEEGLSAEVQQRALQCLSRFKQELSQFPITRVRAIATSTVRQLSTPQSFLIPATVALGHKIEVISGHEEARLIYLGVVNVQPLAPEQQCLVIDIGGGSTEFIIGREYQPIVCESVVVGCITSTLHFFKGGHLSQALWDKAFSEVCAKFQPFAEHFHALGWQLTMGTPGTLKAIRNICTAMGSSSNGISAEALVKLRKQLLKAEHIEGIELPGLLDDRRSILAGGVLILEAALHTLGVRELAVSKAAMREGILYDMLEQANKQG